MKKCYGTRMIPSLKKMGIKTDHPKIIKAGSHAAWVMRDWAERLRDAERLTREG